MFVAVLLILLVVKSYSQDYTKLRLISDEILKLGLSPYEVKSYTEIQGSPYLHSDLLDGKVITEANKVLVGKLRYNIYTDEIEFHYKNSILSFAKPDNFKVFFIDAQKIIYTRFIEGRKTKTGFLLVVIDGDYSLLIRKGVSYIAQEKQQPYSVPKPDRFEPKNDVYFLSYKNQPAIRIVSSKKLIKTFPELETIISNYPIKKVDYETPDGLRKLVEYINSQKVTTN